MAKTPSDIQARKQALRQRIIAARDNLTPSLRIRSSKDIVGQLCGLAAYKTARTVLGYLNFGSELASEVWVRQALEDGKQVLLPRVNKASKQLDLFEIKNLDSEIAVGAYGIREPIQERCKHFDALGKIDLILMPGVAFDREGSRLGYGGGYFDKLLAHLPHRPVLIAGAFAMQVVEEIPQEDTDHKIDWLVTENETIRC
ncbi:MAG: 5-formyltetrahydrofolate cyclo-ligase [Sideroxydans sp.]|jgi:5-formyltetrahydrofolate cyclo-ligase